MRSRRLIGFVLLLALLPLAGCGSDSSAAKAESSGTAVPDQGTANIVSATGEVRPARWAGLSFPVDGRVETILVEEGLVVAAGQPLIQLDAVRLARAAAEAQAALSAAEADLARLKAGAQPHDVAAAEQAVAAAQANVQMAEAGVDAAGAALSQAQAGVSVARAQVAVAQAGVKVAQAELAVAQAGARPEELSAAQAALAQARAAVKVAQANHDRAGGASNTAEALALEQATLDLQIAQAKYDGLAAGPRPADLAPLQAGVQAAQAQLALVKAQAAMTGAQVPAAQAAVAQAEAARAAAQAQAGQAQAALDRLRAGTTAEELAVAEAAVARAREALLTAQAMCDQATLTAPFDGTVALIKVRAGEQVLPGTPVLMLGDLGALQVETTDLDEVDVARVQSGQGVALTFDALPDKVLAGHIVRIAPMAVPGQGATTYTAVIAFDEVDPALRWGMTAFVDIEVGQ
jgi:HlyD family secretion protein